MDDKDYVAVLAKYTDSAPCQKYFVLNSDGKIVTTVMKGSSDSVYQVFNSDGCYYNYGGCMDLDLAKIQDDTIYFYTPYKTMQEEENDTNNKDTFNVYISRIYTYTPDGKLIVVDKNNKIIGTFPYETSYGYCTTTAEGVCIQDLNFDGNLSEVKNNTIYYYGMEGLTLYKYGVTIENGKLVTTKLETYSDDEFIGIGG